MTARFVARRADGNGVAPGAEDSVARAGGSSGAPLPADLRGRFETSLGADLSDVRIHTGAESQAAAEAVGARAYAVGQDVHFGAGHYDPTSSDGQFLIAHEVAHTVQQRGGSTRAQYKLEVSSPGDAAEVEADAAASAMVSGAPASVGFTGGAVMRDAKEGGGGGSVSIGGEFTLAEVKLGETKAAFLDIEAKLGASVKFGGKKAEADGKEKEADEGKKEDVKHGATEHLKQKLEGILHRAKVTAGSEKGIALKGDKKSLTLSPALTLSTEIGPAKLEATPIEISLIGFSKDKGLTGPKIAAGLAATLPVYKDTFRGYELEASAGVSIGVEVTPDYAEIAEWALETLGEDCLVEIGMFAAAAAGVAAIIAGGYIDIKNGSNLATMATDGNRALGEFCSAYDAGLAGTVASGASKDAQAGYGKGVGDLRTLTAKYPADVVKKEAAKKRGEVHAQALKRYRDETIAKYRAANPLQSWSDLFDNPNDQIEDEFDSINRGPGEQRRNKVNRKNLDEGSALAVAKVNAAGAGKIFALDNTIGYVSLGLSRAVRVEARGLHLGMGVVTEPYRFSRAQLDQALLDEDAAGKLSEMAPDAIAEQLIQEQRVVAIFDHIEGTERQALKDQHPQDYMHCPDIPGVDSECMAD